MKTVYLSDGDERRLERIRKLRYGGKEVSDEQLIKNAISTYWLASEYRAEQKAKSPQEERADQRLREESLGLTDDWRDYDDA